MSTPFKKGDAVRQIVTVVHGTVAGFSVDQETGDVQHLVEWAEGEEVKSRYFTADQLEADIPAE